MKQRIPVVARSNRLGVLADDLTGALDVAAQFCKVGFSVRVVIDHRCKVGFASEVVVLSTNSRHDKPIVARQKVQRALRLFGDRNIEFVYKKIDSTCQGNIAAEIEAASSNLKRSAVICPANISQERSVRKGVLIVKGKPQVRISELLDSRRRNSVELTASPGCKDSWHKALRGGKSIIADAFKETDLDRLAMQAHQNPEHLYLVGSAGLAAAYARILAESRSILSASCHNDNDNRLGQTSSVLLVIGSRNSVTLEQVEKLLNNKKAVRMELDELHVASVRRAISDGFHVVLHVPIHERSNLAIRASMVSFFSAIRVNRLSGIVLSGGDTALQVCKVLRPHAIQLIGELQPGLAFGQLLGGDADGLLVCTKPGGFGKADSLLCAVNDMKQLAKQTV